MIHYAFVFVMLDTLYFRAHYMMRRYCIFVTSFNITQQSHTVDVVMEVQKFGIFPKL